MPHIHQLSQIKRSLERSTQFFRFSDVHKHIVKLTDIFQTCRKGRLSTYADGSFKASGLLIQRVEQPKAHQETQDLVFGASFTDHMFMVEHIDGQGWGQPVIKPFGNLSVHPAAQALHYGVCCFEGMKAYLGKDGKARLFRPDMNMARMRRSTSRLRLADYDANELLKCLKELLRLDKAWLPHQEGYSMYIRPFAFSSAHTLGISKPGRYLSSHNNRKGGCSLRSYLAEQ
ncbi:hypothetical protein ABBQ32_004492 [Trebouxia sp. C0010 RCD-2024]